GSATQRRDILRHNLNELMLYRHDPDELALDVHEISCLATRFRSRTASQGDGMVRALRQYAGPVLLIWGEQDVTARARQVAPAIAAQGAGREWRVVPDAGHWVQYEGAAWSTTCCRAGLPASRCHKHSGSVPCTGRAGLGLLVRYAVDLYSGVDHQPRFHAGPRRRMGAE